MSKQPTYERGEVYLIEEHQVSGGEIKKTRPWVLVGASSINRVRSTVVAVPLSTQAKEIQWLSIAVYYNNSIVTAVIDQVRAIDKRRLIQFEGKLSQDEMDCLDEGLRKVLCL